MSWNHRVVRHDKCGEVYYRIHEAFYDDGKLGSITVDGMMPQGRTVEELAEELRRMLRATEQPVLDYKDF